MSQPGIEPQTPCTVGRYSRKEPNRQLIYLVFSPTLSHGFLARYQVLRNKLKLVLLCDKYMTKTLVVSLVKWY